MAVIVLVYLAFISYIFLSTTNGHLKDTGIKFYNGNFMKIISNKPLKFQHPSYKAFANPGVSYESVYNLSGKNETHLTKNKIDFISSKRGVFSKNKGKNINMIGHFHKGVFDTLHAIRRNRRNIENNFNDSEIVLNFYQNLTAGENILSIEDINLNLNWQKFLNINKLGYHLNLAIEGRDEGKLTIVGDSVPEYVLNRLKPNSSYTVNIMPVSCKLQVEFDIKTPRLISDSEAISLINMMRREEKNLTNIRNIAITFKSSLTNVTGYILEVELLTRYDEGSKTVVVQIVNLIPGVELFTVNNLKPCSIYKFNIRKEDREMLELSRAIDSLHSFYVYTGNTDNFKSNFPLNNQGVQTRSASYTSLGKKNYLSSTGVMPRRTVTCYVENESPFSGFACRNSDICVPMNWVCDGEDDCEDGDDELNCRGYSQTDRYDRNNCRKNEFRCNSRGEYSCLPISWLCDGRRDCDDGWDENTINCRRTFNRPGSTLYNKNSVSCDRDYFRCFNGLGCVAPSFVCDGDEDCSDGSDEWRCRTNSRCNSRYEFQCFYDDTPYSAYSPYRNHRCIPKSWVCDDQDDCSNGEDESFETCNLVRRLGTTSGLFSVIKKIVDPTNYF